MLNRVMGHSIRKLQFIREAWLFPLLGKQNIQAKVGCVDRPMVIPISESGKLFLVESGIQDVFRGIRNPGPWNLTIGILNPLPGIWNPQCGLQNPRLS